MSWLNDIVTKLINDAPVKVDMPVAGNSTYQNTVFPEHNNEPSVDTVNFSAEIPKTETEESTTSEANLNSEFNTESPQYKSVYRIAIFQAIKRENNGRAKSIDDIAPDRRQSFIDLANKVTKIVLQMCKKCNINNLAPLIANALGFETGGYAFNKRSMNPEGKKYKGVMQVDMLNICYIYGTLPQDVAKLQRENPGYKNKSKDKILADIEYNSKRYFKDTKLIAELKKKYPTPDSLYNAIKTDVELGLEVGILSLKGKIRRYKGDVFAAMNEYCGNQYSYPYNDVPKTVNL